jgi:hypothetical protein
MSEETKISHTKAFFANPISYVAGIIALGSVVFAWGVSSANKKNDVSTIEKNQTEIKSDIKNIETSISLQNQQWTLFSIKYESDKKNAVDLGEKIKKGITVLDTAMDKHLRQTNRIEERFQFMKDQLEEKKNSIYGWTQ